MWRKEAFAKEFKDLSIIHIYINGRETLKFAIKAESSLINCWKYSDKNHIESPECALKLDWSSTRKVVGIRIRQTIS